MTMFDNFTMFFYFFWCNIMSYSRSDNLCVNRKHHTDVCCILYNNSNTWSFVMFTRRLQISSFYLGYLNRNLYLGFHYSLSHLGKCNYLILLLSLFWLNARKMMNDLSAMHFIRMKIDAFLLLKVLQ